jgi:hypothetical protein
MDYALCREILSYQAEFIHGRPAAGLLAGRGLARTEDLAEWWFALRAHDLLTGRQLS